MNKYIGYALIVAFIVLGVGCEIQVWNECREHNSFTYCWRVLGK